MLFLTLTDENGNVLARFDSTKSEDHEIFNNLMLDGEHLLSNETNKKLTAALGEFYTQTV